MTLTLRFPTPQSYVYMSKSPQTIIDGVRMETSDDIVGLYSIKFIDIPKVNERKWGLYIQTEYLEDKESDTIEMDFNDLIGNELKEVIEYTKEQFLSPKIFIDIKLFDVEGKLIPYNIDWDTLLVTTEPDETERKYQKIAIGVYVDNKYLNETVVTMNNSSNQRFNRSKTQ